MPQLTGGEALVRMLQLHGLEYAFGMGGFQTLPYYDALARQTQIKHVLMRDEKHAAFAADGYARVTNKPALADATLGPGATNLVSGAAESFGASIPLLLLTGEVNSMIKGRAATQESDQLGMLRPTSKLTIELQRIERIPELVRRAYAVATSGRPGPVLLDVPEDVSHGTYDFPANDLYADPAATEVGQRRVRGDAAAIEHAARAIVEAQRPVAIVGGGVHLSRAYAELAAFIEATGMPLAYTISGKGAMSDTHPLVAGLCGRYSRYANDLIKNADLLVVLGSKLGEISTARWTAIPDTAKLVHVDVDPAEIGKVYRTQIGVTSDLKLALQDLIAAIGPGRDARTKDRKERQRVESEKARESWMLGARPSMLSTEEPLAVPRVLHELRQALPEDSIVVADGGFAAHWSALLFDVVGPGGRHFVANRGHAAIGYGLAGAIGAKLAAPRTPVVALCGDNGFAMAVAELETAHRAGAPVIAVVLNNGALGYVKALQHGMYSDRFVSVDFLDVDYGAVGRAFGCEGRRVTTAGQLQAGVREALDSDRPTVLDVMITTDPSKMLPGIDARVLQRPMARS